MRAPMGLGPETFKKGEVKTVSATLKTYSRFTADTLCILDGKPFRLRKIRFAGKDQLLHAGGASMPAFFFEVDETGESRAGNICFSHIEKGDSIEIDVEAIEDGTFTAMFSGEVEGLDEDYVYPS